MKKLALLLIAAPLVACDMSAPKASSSLDATHSKKVTFNEFRKFAADASANLENAGDCAFTVAPAADGIVLTITEGERITATFPVHRNDAISVVSREGEDVFTVKGTGQLDIVNADDAYYRVSLIQGKDVRSCEVDF